MSMIIARNNIHVQIDPEKNLPKIEMCDLLWWIALTSVCMSVQT